MGATNPVTPEYTAGLGLMKRTPQGVMAMKVRYLPGAIESGSTVKMVKIPKGMTVVDLYLVSEAQGSGATAAIGDSAGAGTFAAATSVAAAAIVRQTLGPKTYTADDYIVVTTGGATYAADKYLTLVVFLANDIS